MNKHAHVLACLACAAALLLPAALLGKSPPLPAGARVTIVFENGNEREFAPVSDLSAAGDVITFTDKQGRAFSFLKGHGVAGWAVQ